MADIKIDWAQIQAWEGFRTKLYIPECTGKSVINPKSDYCFGKKKGSPIGNSGATIGSGVDLGQQNERGLRNIGIPEGTISKLKPLIGQKREDAQKVLKDNPDMTFRDTEVRQIDIAVKKDSSNTLSNEFRKRSGGKEFASLPPQVQTVVFSIYWQRRNYLFKEGFESFWKYILSGNYTEAASELEKIKLFNERRKKEATYMRSVALGT